MIKLIEDTTRKVREGTVTIKKTLLFVTVKFSHRLEMYH